MSRGALALAVLLAGRTAPADRLPTALPGQAWNHVDAYEIGGAGSSAPVLLPDGRVAVLSAGPSMLHVVDGATGSMRASSLEARPDGDPLPRLDAAGNIVFRAHSTLYRLGADGRVRSTVQLPPGELASVVSLADGSEVALVRGTDHAEFVSMRPDGTVVAIRILPGSSNTTAVALGPSAVAMGIPRGIGILRSDGLVNVVPACDAIAHLAAARGAVLAVTESSVFPVGADGSIGAPRPLPARTAWWSGAPDGTFLAFTPGPSSTLLRVAANGALLDRFPVPSFVESVTVTDDGTLLLATARGRLVALEHDGRTRWLVDLQRGIVPHPVLAGADAWVSTTDGALLHLSVAPASEAAEP